MRALGGSRSAPAFDAERELSAFAMLVSEVTGAGGVIPSFLSENSALSVARAPGRLDVMGGIADYSGSLVLELPTQEAAFCAVQSGTPGVVVASVDPVSRAVRKVTLDPEFVEGATYAEARAHFGRDAATHWAAYVAGLLFVLRIELGVRFETGVRILLASTVPEGKGVSSSAAVEVSTLCALLAEQGMTLDASAIATLAQKAENLVAGAPCGIMDQLTAAGALPDQLLEILCQPASLRGTVPVPGAFEFLGLDSGVRHAVTGADYSAVRVAAFMGYRIIAARAGLSATVSDGLATVDDVRWGGFLANLTPGELEGHRAALPVSLSGEEFLASYGGTTDPVTAVDPFKHYPVRNATEHPVFEHARVRRFRELLASTPDARSAEELGALMASSHASYSACGLGSEATDEIVRLVASESSGELVGAKITGGGSGGTVAIAARAGARAAVERVAEMYLRATGRKAHLFHGSSPGALHFGAFRLHFAAEGASKLKRISE